jgi:DNA ligase-1
MPNLPANSLEQFARTAEAVAATTKKLQKAALLGAHFEQLNDDDLARAARYFAGHQFAQSDARTTNVGGSILSEALCGATGVAPESLGPMRWGDGGDVA